MRQAAAGAGSAIAYLFRVSFSTPDATPVTSPYAGEVGSVTVADVSSLLSIADGEAIVASGGTTNSPNLVSTASMARAKGRLVSLKSTNGNAGGLLLGWSSGAAGTTYTHRLNPTTGTSLRTLPNFAVVGTLINDAVYWFCVILRATGAYYFVRGGNYGYWCLVWVENTDTSANLYPAWSNFGSVGKRMDDFVVPDVLWWPDAQASDSFTRSNGALGTSNDYEGGSAAAWTSALGTGEVISNAAGFTALSGGVGIAIIEGNDTDVTLTAALTWGAGNVGIVFRYVDTNNYIRAYHDGTRLKIDKVVAGSVTAVVSDVFAYAAGAHLVITANKTDIRITYNNGQITVGGTISDAALQTGTKVGIYSTDTGNRVDNFAVWAFGTSGEYNALKGYAQITSPKTYLACDGDSLTQGQSVATSYPYQLADLLGRATHDYCNYGVSGQSALQCAADASYTIDPLASSFTDPICIAWMGTNDIVGGASQATTYNAIVSYCQARRTAGYRAVVLTILPRSAFDPTKEAIRVAVNADIVANYATFADGLVDVAADSRLDDFNDTTYFLGDKTHLTTAGYAVVAGLAQTVINAM